MYVIRHCYFIINKYYSITYPNNRSAVITKSNIIKTPTEIE